MEKKPVSMPVIIAIIAISLIAVVVYGWNTVASPRRGANGEDLSRPAVPPADMGQKYQQQAKPH